jgi:ABC-type Fe3+/spermidine/putrescine transport system ATPase subunit
VTIALRLDSVSAGYGRGRVLHDVTLDVEAGTLVALLGPSGCGKTTALKVIAGLVAPDSGEIWFGSEAMTRVPAEKRGIAMVFQKPLLFPHMNVADNVAFGLLMRGWPAERRREAVESALRLVHLEGFGSRRPKELSGGQEQRVTLARALVTEPRILLLDEPLSALDESLRVDMRALIRDLQRRLAITTIFVTHDQGEAAEIADEVVLLLDGRVAQVGAPRAYYTAPASEAVARFFGWCVLRATCDRGVVRAGGGTFELASTGAGSGEPCAVAFHPSAARLCPGAPPDSEPPGALPVTVEHVTDLGTQLRITVRFPSGERIDLVQPATDGSAETTPAGADARLVVPPAALWFFPRAGVP